MFGKVVLILASFGTLQANYLRGPGNSTVLVPIPNTSKALVPYKSQQLISSPIKKCKTKKTYYWNNATLKVHKDL